LVYKTCNEEGDADGISIYMHDVPNELELYLQEFVPLNGSTKIIDGPTVVQCHDYGRGPHSFLEAKGVFSCSECSATVCCFCLKKLSGMYKCLDCICSDIPGLEVNR